MTTMRRDRGLRAAGDTRDERVPCDQSEYTELFICENSENILYISRGIDSNPATGAKGEVECIT